MRIAGRVTVILVALGPVIASCKDKGTIEAAPQASVSASAPASASASASAPASASASVGAGASASASTVGSDAVDCAGLLAAATSRLDLVRMKHGRCKADGDCVTVRGGACITACDEAMATTGVAEYEEARKRTEPLCATYFRADCIHSHPVPAAACMTMKPRCMAGTCMASPM
jgi:hypothetical protein